MEGSAPGEVDSEEFPDDAVVLVANHTYAHMGVPLTQDGAPVVIAFITPAGKDILGVVHPPIKYPSWSKITASPIDNLTTAAMTVTPVRIPEYIKADPLPGPGAIGRIVSVQSITGHILAVISGC